MTSLPSDAEVRARAEELKLIEPGADLPPAIRKHVAKALLEESQRPPVPPAAYEPVLLSRVTQPASGGMVRVDVLFIPTPPPQEGSNR